MQREVQSFRRRLFVYGLSTGFVFIVLILRLSLSTIVEASSAFLLFLAAVMASAWLGGTGPGLYATLLSSVVANFFFMEPKFNFGFTGFGTKVEWVLFLLEGTVTAILAGQLHRARNDVLQGQQEARNLERRILEISDAEQRRIGHDLHDGLGQHLTGIALMTRQLEQRFTADSSPHAGRLVKIADLAQTAVSWTHDLARSLSPPVLESRGLAAALAELANNARNIFGIDCTFEAFGPADFRDVAVGVHLYRIAQEAISNAVKHGHALSVTIRLIATDTALSMEIADDGSGMQVSTGENEGMGLRIMQYRANMIGAAMRVEQRTRTGGKGVLVTCQFPLAGRQGPISEND